MSASDLEPLAYRDYLCDIQIEYNSGFNRSGNSINCKESFKLKCLPYLVTLGSLNTVQNERCNSPASNNRRDDLNNGTGSSSSSSSSFLIDNPSDFLKLDVTKTTSAFLGDSEHAPNSPNRRRRVVLELISAKLSQSTHYVPAILQHAPALLPTQVSKCTPPRRPSDTSSTPPQSPLPSSSNRSRLSFPSLTPGRQLSRNSSQLDLTNGVSRTPQSSSSASPAPPAVSSKRFVNYTLLIRTVPGLDVHPTVIERRFSDFSLLYQGLKVHEPYGNIVDQQVNFPKKVYIGNYSLVNIAERSIEFAKLLNLCISEVDLQCSIPFVSFLLDKELREAHRLFMFGDPEDVQVVIETVYNIVLKLYLRNKLIQITEEDRSANGSLVSSINVEPHLSISPICPSPTSSNGNDQKPNGTQVKSESISDPVASPPQSPVTKISERDDSRIVVTPPWLKRISTTAINQRILATFAILFLNCSRSNNYVQFREVVRVFSKLVEDTSYVGSLSGRYNNTLRACMNFILATDLSYSNIGHDILDETQRALLEQKLQEIEANHMRSEANSNNLLNAGRIQVDPNQSNGNVEQSSAGSDGLDSFKVELNLAALVRTKDFCLFQDGKFTNKR